MSTPSFQTTFHMATCALSLPPCELSSLRTLLPPRPFSHQTLLQILRRINLPDPGLAHALFALSDLFNTGSIHPAHFLTTYANLRHLAFHPSQTIRRQSVLSLLFFSAGAGSHSTSWKQWVALASELGLGIGGIDSIPAEHVTHAMFRTWCLNSSNWKSRYVARNDSVSLGFQRFVHVLGMGDAGVLEGLQAMGFVLTCAVIQCFDLPVEKPVWNADVETCYLSQFMSFAIAQAAAAQTAVQQQHHVGDAVYVAPLGEVQSADISNTFSTEEKEERWVSLEKSDALDVDSSTGSTVRRTRNGVHGNSPFHIDYSALTLGEKIGSGAYGDVYQGTYLMSPVAIKMFHVNLQQKQSTTATSAENEDPSMMSRMASQSALERFATVNSVAKYRNFVREVEMMSVLRHPNLVLYMGACGDPVTPLCIVSELFTGGALYEYLHGGGMEKPSVQVACSFCVNIARGMYYLHSSEPSILHRDLKSRNVLLSGRKGLDGVAHVVICDFGLCQLFGDAAAEQGGGGGGGGGGVIGTASYMAPDVINGDKYEAADDVYSFGILMHEIFTASVPYAGMRAAQVLYRVANEALRPSCAHDEHIPPEMDELMRQCWDADRRKRPTFDTIIRRLTHFTS